MKRALTAAGLALAALLPLGQASTAVRLDVEGLVHHAELVFEGRVVTARSYRKQAGPSGQGPVETEFFVTVQRTFLGQPTGTRVFRLPGGVLPDGSGMVVPGMPSMREGDTALFFLSEESPVGWRLPVGLAQGKLDVVVGSDGRRALQRSANHLNLVDPVTGRATKAASQAAALDYEQTVRRIEAAVLAEREGR